MTNDSQPLRLVSKVWPVKENLHPDGQALKKNIIFFPEHGDWSVFDPFLMMAEDWMLQGSDYGPGFELHPHRGFETVTNVLEGKLEHRDTKGGRGVLQAGDVQWTTTGRGVLHSEMPVGPQVTRVTQLWLNLPRADKMTEPRYQDISRESMPKVLSADGRAIAHVFSGVVNGAKSATKNHVPVIGFDAMIQQGSHLSITIPAAYNAFAYVLTGSGQVSDKSVTEKHAAHLPPRSASNAKIPPAATEEEVTFVNEDKEDFRLLFFAGMPLGEPVVQRGPFVMNTNEEILEAFADYRSGKLR
eukprot:TRINITY_DN35511_c0_g1_i1.p1 TRINITY_DN35511_c0_g1~~TRINITY_DN35511_c0_g1_i1.p1  ORF type:complete len:300 (-),score=54.11 TRINITY_DN35511_c0_g1_i1:770-1669(-)